MRPFIVIVEKPDIKVLLELAEIRIDFFAEGHLVKFLKDGYVEPFADPIGLWRPGFSFGMLDIIDSQIELKIVTFWLTTVFGPSVRQNAQKW
jgi:hypothetical protein